MITPIQRWLLATFLCLSLWAVPIQIHAQDNSELHIAHSQDRPSSLWTGLDATVEEIERDGRVSIFNLHKRRSPGATAGRFFICTMVFLTKQRGYVNYLGAEPIDGRSVVIFLKEHDEDIQAIIDDGYREYNFLIELVLRNSHFCEICV